MLNKELQLNDLFTTLTVARKNCLYISDNKAVKRQKELYPMSQLTGAKSNLYVEMKQYDFSVSLRLYIDYGFVTYDLNSGISEYDTGIELIQRLNSIPVEQLTYEWMKNSIVTSANNNRFINVGEIALLELAGESQDTIELLYTSRNNFLKARQEKEEQEQKAKLEKATQEYNSLMEKYNNTLEEAEKAILEKEIVWNKEIQFPELEGHYVYKNDRNLVLDLFKKYDIKVPLKTQGWINKALAKIEYKEDYYTYSYYTSSKNSTAFMKYLEMLVVAIQEAYGKVETELQEKIEKEQVEENKEKCIPTLKWKEIDRYSMRDRMDNNIFIKKNEFVALKDEQLEEVARIAFKALNSNNIDLSVDTWKIQEEWEEDNKDYYYFRYNGKSVTVYPRMVNGKVKMLYLKDTKKEYMCIA